MRGLNIKKMAAVALGTALVGATIAPLVSALDNSSNITKGDVVSLTTGLPSVSIVVGSGAGTSDAVWAGNIAATIAQLATVDKSAGESSTIEGAKVDLSIGGKKTYDKASSKTVDSKYLYSEDSGVEYDYTGANALTSGSLNYLVNKTYQYRYDETMSGSSSTTDITVKEKIGVKSDVKFDTDKDVDDLVAEIKAGNFYYEVDLGNGVPIQHSDSGTWKDFTDTATDHIKIPIFGEDYILQSVSDAGGTTKLTLVKSSATTDYAEGQTIENLDGKGAYAGQKVKAKIVAITQTGPNATYEAKVELYDSEDNKIASAKVGAGAFINDILVDDEGEYVLSTILYVDSVTMYPTEGTGHVSLIVGDNVLEIKDGKVFPYDSTDTDTSDDYWKARLTVDTSSNPYKLKKIKIENSKYTWRKSDKGYLYSANNSLQGKEDQSEAVFMAGFPETTPGYGFAKVIFNGFKGDQERTEIEFGDGKVKFKDYDGIEREVPFYTTVSINHDSEDSFETSGRTYYVKCYEYDQNSDAASLRVAQNDVVNGITITALPSGNVAAENTVYLHSPSGAIDTTPNADAIPLKVRNAFTAGDTTIDLYSDYACMVSKAKFDQATDSDYMVAADKSLVTDTAADHFMSNSEEKYRWFLPNVSDYKYESSAVRLTGDAANDSVLDYSLLAHDNELYLLLNKSTDFITEFKDKTSQVDIEFVGTDTEPAVTGGNENGTIDTDYYVPHETDIGAPATSNDYFVAQFKVKGVSAFGEFKVNVDTATGDLITPNNELSTWSYMVQYTNGTSNMLSSLNLGANEDNTLMKAYDDYGTKVWIEDSKAYFSAPEAREYLSWTVAGKSTQTVVEGGETFTGLEVGKTAEKGDYKVTVTKVEGTAKANYKEIVPLTNRLVYQDNETYPAGAHIIVGGYAVNELAKNVVLSDSSTLQEALVSAGDYVVDMLDNGDIVVAGYNADDTATAAQKLISQLQSFV